jgi:hypothetical protein
MSGDGAWVTMDALVAGAVEALREWAARTGSIRELWLFGSRATGAWRTRDCASPDWRRITIQLDLGSP